MGGLFDRVRGEQFPHLIQTQYVYGQILRRVQMTLAHRLHAGSRKQCVRLFCVLGLAEMTMISRHCPPPKPVSSDSSRWADTSGETSFSSHTPAQSSYSVIPNPWRVLSHEHILAVFRHGDRIDPFRVFQHVVFRDNTPIGQFQRFATGGQPGTLRNIPAGQYLDRLFPGVFFHR